LIAEGAVDCDVEAVAAGRNEVRTGYLGRRLDCESHSFEAAGARENLDGVDAVLNCAGPSVEMYEPLVEACPETGTSYLGITGELSAFEAIAERDWDAEKASVRPLPGVGFDVVPTDCPAGHLHDRLPESPGRLRPRRAQHRHHPVRRRLDGLLHDRHRRRGGVHRSAEGPETALRVGRIALPLLSVPTVKQMPQTMTETFVAGPSDRRRGCGTCYVGGEATDGERTITSRSENAGDVRAGGGRRDDGHGARPRGRVRGLRDARGGVRPGTGRLEGFDDE